MYWHQLRYIKIYRYLKSINYEISSINSNIVNPNKLIILNNNVLMYNVMTYVVKKINAGICQCNM